MKVLYIASSTAMAGGATKSLILMLTQMHKYGIEVEVVCPDEKGLTMWLKENGIKVHIVRFKAVYLPSYKTISDIIKWIPRVIYYSYINYRGKASLKRIAKDVSPDIIHENTSTINIGYHVSKSIGVPDIVHIREYGYLDFKMIIPDRKSRLQNKNVFSISITKDIRRHLGLDSNPRSTQIYDGIVESSDFRINPEKKRWFLYAGRIDSGKGIEDLLEAYVEYANSIDDPFPLYVCGGTTNESYLKRLKSIVKKNGLGSKVKWLGERSDLDNYMYDATATIIPSRFEGLGRVMPEAMTNGSLCVAKYTGGTKEQLDNGMQLTGKPIAISYDNKDKLKEILHNITATVKKGNAFSSGSEYIKMIERSQIAVKEFFTDDSFGEKVINFYNSILDKIGQTSNT